MALARVSEAISNRQMTEETAADCVEHNGSQPERETSRFQRIATIRTGIRLRYRALQLG